MPWILTKDNRLVFEEAISETRVKEVVAEQTFPEIEAKLLEKYTLNAKSKELQEGIRELSGEAGTDQEPGLEEQG